MQRRAADIDIGQSYRALVRPRANELVVDATIGKEKPRRGLGGTRVAGAMAVTWGKKGLAK